MDAANDLQSIREIQAAIKELKKRAMILDSSQSCLLYTSPSPRDRTRSRMPSSA